MVFLNSGFCVPRKASAGFLAVLTREGHLVLSVMGVDEAIYVSGHWSRQTFPGYKMSPGFRTFLIGRLAISIYFPPAYLLPTHVLLLSVTSAMPGALCNEEPEWFSLDHSTVPRSPRPRNLGSVTAFSSV